MSFREESKEFLPTTVIMETENTFPTKERFERVMEMYRIKDKGDPGITIEELDEQDEFDEGCKKMFKHILNRGLPHNHKFDIYCPDNPDLVSLMH